MYGRSSRLRRLRQSASRSRSFIAGIGWDRSPVRERNAIPQSTLDLRVVGLGMACADPRACDIASHFVEAECDGESFLAGHPAVAGDLLVKAGVRLSRELLRSASKHSIVSPSPDAPGPARSPVLTSRYGRRR